MILKNWNKKVRSSPGLYVCLYPRTVEVGEVDDAEGRIPDTRGITVQARHHVAVLVTPDSRLLDNTVQHVDNKQLISTVIKATGDSEIKHWMLGD